VSHPIKKGNLAPFHRIDDRVQRHNVLALIERMTP